MVCAFRKLNLIFLSSSFVIRVDAKGATSENST